MGPDNGAPVRGLIEDGLPAEKAAGEIGGGGNITTHQFYKGGHALRVPSLDIVEVGAGGQGGLLKDHHGAVGVGKSSKLALRSCELVERMANIYFLAQTLSTAINPRGEINELPADVVNAEIALFKMQMSQDRESNF